MAERQRRSVGVEGVLAGIAKMPLGQGEVRAGWMAC